MRNNQWSCEREGEVEELAGLLIFIAHTRRAKSRINSGASTPARHNSRAERRTQLVVLVSSPHLAYLSARYGCRCYGGGRRAGVRWPRLSGYG